MGLQQSKCIKTVLAYEERWWKDTFDFADSDLVDAITLVADVYQRRWQRTDARNVLLWRQQNRAGAGSRRGRLAIDAKHRMRVLTRPWRTSGPSSRRRFFGLTCGGDVETSTSRGQNAYRGGRGTWKAPSPLVGFPARMSPMPCCKHRKALAKKISAAPRRKKERTKREMVWNEVASCK